MSGLPSKGIWQVKVAGGGECVGTEGDMILSFWIQSNSVGKKEVIRILIENFAR